MADSDPTAGDAFASLEERADLEAPLRRLVCIGIATWRADWTGLAAILARCERDGEDRNRVAEVLLQGVLFFGFPRTVSAFGVLSKAWQGVVGDVPSVAADEQAAAGRDLFARIYAERDEAVRGMLHGYHPEFHDFVLEAAYGRILSRPLLSPRERELCAVGALAAMDQIPQWIAHARGSIHCGAERSEVAEATWSALRSDAEVERLLGRV